MCVLQIKKKLYAKIFEKETALKVFKQEMNSIKIFPSWLKRFLKVMTS